MSSSEEELETDSDDDDEISSVGLDGPLEGCFASM